MMGDDQRHYASVSHSYSQWGSRTAEPGLPHSARGSRHQRPTGDTCAEQPSSPTVDSFAASDLTPEVGGAPFREPFCSVLSSSLSDADKHTAIDDQYGGGDGLPSPNELGAFRGRPERDPMPGSRAVEVTTGQPSVVVLATRSPSSSSPPLSPVDPADGVTTRGAGTLPASSLPAAFGSPSSPYRSSSPLFSTAKSTKAMAARLENSVNGHRDSSNYLYPPVVAATAVATQEGTDARGTESLHPTAVAPCLYGRPCVEGHETSLRYVDAATKLGPAELSSVQGVSPVSAFHSLCLSGERSGRPEKGAVDCSGRKERILDSAAGARELRPAAHQLGGVEVCFPERHAEAARMAFPVEGSRGRVDRHAGFSSRMASTAVTRLALRVAASVSTVAETLHGHWRRLRGRGRAVGFNGVSLGDEEDNEELGVECELRELEEDRRRRRDTKGTTGKFPRSGVEELGDEPSVAEAVSKKYERWKCAGVEQTAEGLHPRENQRLCTLVFTLIFLLEVFVNFDCGAVPASLSQIALDFRLSATWQGLVGALPYVGLTLASPCVGRFLALWRPKPVIILTMALNVAAMLLLLVTYFLSSTASSASSGSSSGIAVTAAVIAEPVSSSSTVVPSAQSVQPANSSLFSSLPSFPSFNVDDLSPSAWLLLGSRFFVGLTQAAFVIYAPVWVDEFAPPQYAALWMGIVQGAAVVGVTVGYLVSAVFCVYFLLDWRWSFLLQAVVVAALVAALHELPSEAIDTCEKHLSSTGTDDEEDASAVRGGERENHAQQTGVRDRCRVTHRPSVHKGNFASVSTVELSSPDALGGLGSDKTNVRSRSRVEGQAPEETHALKVVRNQFPRVSQESRDWSGSEPDWTNGSGEEPTESPDCGLVSPGVPVVSCVVLPSAPADRRESGSRSEHGRSDFEKERLKDRRGRGGEVVRPLDGGHSHTSEKQHPGFASLTVAGGSNRFTLPTREVRVLMVPEGEDRSQRGAGEVTSRAKRGRESGPRRRAGLAERSSRRTGRSLSTAEMMKRLASNPLYILPVFTLSALLFVVTGVQFWGTVHLTSNLQMPPSVAMLAFAAVAASAPTAGVIAGGIMVDRLGGYKTLDAKVKTLHACLGAAGAAVLFGFAGALTRDALTFVLSLWFLLCFGAALLPPLTGLQIAAVETPLRTFASGLSMFTYNICGYALGTFLPGAVMDLVNEGDVVGMRLILFWSLLGLVGVLATTVFARRELKNELLRAVEDSSADTCDIVSPRNDGRYSSASP